MNKFVLILSVLFFQSWAQADLVKTFKSLDKSRKGPFSLNYLQAPHARVPVLERPPSNILFQAAFRNDIGRELATQYDFYVANLFTTNYYELIGEYVFGDAYGNHPLDHQGLIEKSAQSRPKAASMTRHWALERYYVRSFPKAALSRSFGIRGISGSEFEQVYAQHFFNFYLGAIETEFEYLPAVLLAKDSPIGASASLDKARHLISVEYEEINSYFGSSDSRARQYLYVRNLVHNVLTPKTIEEIDRYLREHSYYKSSGYRALYQVRDILVEFFSFGADKITTEAKAIKETKIEEISKDITRHGVNAARLYALSEAGAELRDRLVNHSVVYENRAATLKLLSSTTLFISKELSSLKSIVSKEAFLASINAVYIEGFLIKDNWQFFKKEIKNSQGPKAASAIMADMISIASATLEQAFEPSFDQWKKVEPKMVNFLDDSLKASAVSSSALIVQKILGEN